jgi:prepilin-type N-terminal cleavage/methylation domain-containing protein
MLRREEGLTLIELMIAMALGLVVMAAATAVLIGGMHRQPREEQRSAAIQRARTTMERITRELRQGTSVPAATATQLSIVTYVDQATCAGAASANAVLCRVTYTCSAGACSRTVARPDGSSPGAATRVVDGLSPGSVFSYSASGGSCTLASATLPTGVCIKLAFPGSGANNAITLEDGVGLRNA